ncbi:MAG: hypothetical protein RL201_541, partial [Actinomycetota bacterium]
AYVVILIGYFIAGAGVGPIYPGFITILGNTPGIDMASALARAFMIAMIAGRLGANRITQRFHIHHTVRFLGLVGGFGFLIFLAIAVNLPAELKHWALAATCIAFAFGGAGSSLMAPTFYTAGNTRSNLPSAVLVGQMGVVNNIAVIILKATVAWTAQFTGSLAIALVIPAVLLLSAAYFARVLKTD